MQLIADRLSDVVEVAHRREYRTVTGYYEGRWITACSSGMGCPSTAIGVEELARAGASTFIRVGSTAALQPHIGVGDLVISEGSLRNDGTTAAYVPAGYPAVPDLELTRCCAGWRRRPRPSAGMGALRTERHRRCLLMPSRPNGSPSSPASQPPLPPRGLRAARDGGRARRDARRSPAGTSWEDALVLREPADLTAFLACVAAAYPLLGSREALARVAREAVEDAAADGCRFLELRFGPITHTREGDGVVGFDIAGDELLFPDLAPYAQPFAIAAAAGLGLTAHVAEAGPAENIRLAHEKLGVARIGHGTHVAASSEMTAYADEHGLCFEVCPTSNVLTGVSPSVAEHPVHRFLEVGCRVVLGDDDPVTTGSSLAAEVAKLHESGVTDRQLAGDRADVDVGCVL